MNAALVKKETFFTDPKLVYYSLYFKLCFILIFINLTFNRS